MTNKKNLTPEQLEKRREKNRVKYAANREKVTEYQRAYQGAYREANREKLAEYQRKSREKNKLLTNNNKQ